MFLLIAIPTAGKPAAKRHTYTSTVACGYIPRSREAAPRGPQASLVNAPSHQPIPPCRPEDGIAGAAGYTQAFGQGPLVVAYAGGFHAEVLGVLLSVAVLVQCQQLLQLLPLGGQEGCFGGGVGTLFWADPTAS